MIIRYVHDCIRDTLHLENDEMRRFERRWRWSRSQETYVESHYRMNFSRLDQILAHGMERFLGASRSQSRSWMIQNDTFQRGVCYSHRDDFHNWIIPWHHEEGEEKEDRRDVDLTSFPRMLRGASGMNMLCFPIATLLTIVNWSPSSSSGLHLWFPFVTDVVLGLTTWISDCYCFLFLFLFGVYRGGCRE